MSDRRGGVDIDPSVCYRHPGRQSWVLCQRCGKTVCPECQILAPVGVHCPDCVAETSGGVQWRAVGGTVTPLKPKRRRSSARVRTLLAGGGARSGGAPVASQTILAVAAALFVVGLLTDDLPFMWLAGIPGTGVQVWRFVTSPFSYYTGVSGSIIYFLLGCVFFWLTAPQLERALGIARFLGVFVVASVIGTAGTMLSGLYAYGFTAPLFGLFAALLIEVWHDQSARIQILVMTGINLLVALWLGGLPAIVGGMVGGAGFLYLVRLGPERGWKPRTPLLIVGAVCVALAALAALRG